MKNFILLVFILIPYHFILAQENPEVRIEVIEISETDNSNPIDVDLKFSIKNKSASEIYLPKPLPPIGFDGRPGPEFFKIIVNGECEMMDHMVNDGGKKISDFIIIEPLAETTFTINPAAFNLGMSCDFSSSDSIELIIKYTPDEFVLTEKYIEYNYESGIREELKEIFKKIPSVGFQSKTITIPAN